MIAAMQLSGPGAPFTLMGPLGFAVADVKALQTALKGYATKTGDAAADPGAIDGVVGTRTLSAVAAVITKIPSSKIPATVRTALQLVLTMGLPLMPAAMKEQVAGVVAENAAYLAAGVAYLTTKAEAGAGGAGGAAYPAGSIQRWNIYRKVWRVYAPVGSLSGCGCGLGDAVMLLSGPAPIMLMGRDIPTKAPPGMTLLAELTSKAAGVTDGGTEDEPLYKKTWFWVAVAGGTAVIGGGLYWGLK